MDEEQLKKIIGLVFIRGYEEFSLVITKTQLAEKITEARVFNDVLNSKSLLNYFNYLFFKIGKKVNPNENTIDALLQYIDFKSQKAFKIYHLSSNDDYLKEVPFTRKNNEEEEKPETSEKEKIDANKNSNQQNNPIHITVNNQINNDVNNQKRLNSDHKKQPEHKDKQDYKSNILVVFGVIGLVSILCVFFFSGMFQGKSDSNLCYYWDSKKVIIAPCGLIQDAIKIEKSAIESININTFRRIEPNNETQFFSEDTNQPQVWYASYNNELEFFNEKGNHPLTGRRLQPVTKEIVKIYSVDKENIKDKKKEFAETIPFKKIEEQTTISTEEKTETSILNPSVVNAPNTKEISVFIFDSINKLESAFSNHLKQELRSKNYKVTSNLIFQSELNTTIIEHLQSGNVRHFKNELEKHTDYICVGNVSYEFSKNTIREDMTTCKMQIDYSIISTITGETTSSYSNLIIGTGVSKTTAKTNTIKKFKL